VFYLCQEGPTSISQEAHSSVLHNAALNLQTKLEMRAATLQGCQGEGQWSLGVRGKGGPSVPAGVSHRAELNLSLCEAVFSPARLPAPTTEYPLPNHSSAASRGLQLLPSFG